MTDVARLGARERQVFDIVVRLDRATVQEVREQIPDAPTYSTVRAILRMLEQKGFLRHAQDGFRYAYFSSVPKEAAQRKALSHLVKVYFKGSPEAAAMALLEMPARRTDPERFEQLRELIARKASKKKTR